MDDDKIIEYMADGCWHSGVEIASAFGLSRAAVWKRLQKLSSKGLEVQREQSKGYRLAYRFEPLDARVIGMALTERIMLSIKPITTSTNIDALEAVKSGGVMWPQQSYLVLAEQQTAGKGRRGRDWQSPYGANLYLSWAATLPVGVAALEGLSLAVGVLVAKILTAHGIEDVKVKWPNDVYVAGKKIAGILIEVDGDLTSRCNLVVGVGINFSYESLNADAIGQPFTAVDCYSRLSRNEMVTLLSNGIELAVEEICSSHVLTLLAEWHQFDFLANKRVDLSLGNQVVSGVARGVNASGNLMVELESGEIRSFAGGEVSARPRG